MVTDRHGEAWSQTSASVSPHAAWLRKEEPYAPDTAYGSARQPYPRMCGTGVDEGDAAPGGAEAVRF
jgi:hypothetical protein